MKKYLSIILIILILLSSTLCACSDIDFTENDADVSSITSDISNKVTGLLIASYNRKVDLEKGKDCEGYVKVEGTNEFNISDFEFVSEDEKIATIEYQKVSNDTNVFYIIKGIGAGQTKVYVRTKDKKIKSDDIIVTVLDIPSKAKEETTVKTTTFSLSNVPKYSGNPYVEINNNVPYFTSDEITTISYEKYSNLDKLGRCNVASACVGKDIMPTEERGNIGMIKPSGWQISKYDFVDGKYLYNRCHLLGFQLTGENANEKNLITGTRYLNIQGMLPFENMVADYVKETNNHVMYRVTPIFEGNNLLCNGVLMEGYSVEDNGSSIEFCVFAYNVQPNVYIDYSNGDNRLADDSKEKQNNDSNDTSKSSVKGTYVLNTKSKKIHRPDCSSVKQMSDKNRQDVTDTLDDLISQGYEPCQRCNPKK